MKTLEDLYALMVEEDMEPVVLNLKAEYPESLDTILSCLPETKFLPGKYDHKKFGDLILEEYIFPILRNDELKCRMPINRLAIDNEKLKEYKTEKVLFSHKMDIEKFIDTFRKEWNLDQNMEIFTEFGIPSIVWKDE